MKLSNIVIHQTQEFDIVVILQRANDTHFKAGITRV